MTTQDNIEDFFAQLREEIAARSEIKEWEETMRKYCLAYIKNEGLKFITPEDILNHLIEQGGIVRFPASYALDAEAKLEKYLSRLMTDLNETQDGEANNSAE